MIRASVIFAVAKRNFRSYFAGILGYLFIVVFCVAAAMLAFDARFFASNQANLDQLSDRFPLLLLFLIPAITMTSWAEERKMGTDELLFTLPTSELEVLLGKYFSVLAVYSVALLFSLINALVLSFLGEPDIGLLFSSYFGYWLSGAALLSVGMLASALTNSATVAFVLGVVFCCLPVFIHVVPGVLEWILSQSGSTSNLYAFRTSIESLALNNQLHDFSLGVIPFSSICYFGFLTTLMLYLNLVVISRRRWASGSSSVSLSLHFLTRAFALFVTFVSFLVIFDLFPLRADMTAENLFTLSSATTKALSGIDANQKITIQAFVSPEVPREYNETRRQLLGLLREFDLRGGGKVDVRVVNVEPFSQEAEEARALGVNPVRIQYEQDGKFEEAEVFLGATVQSLTDNVEIPFFGKGLPIEYELTRSVRTVAQKERLTVGVLLTDAGVIAESDGTGNGERDWEIVRELRKQYRVIAVNPSQKILKSGNSAKSAEEKAEDPSGETTDENSEVEDFDVLLAVAPSSLTQPQMDHLLEYVRAGKPTLIFEDPCPVFAMTQFGLTMAPKMPKPSPGGGGMFGGQRPEEKADNGMLSSLLNLLDVSWDNGQIVYDRMNPHSQFSTLPPEYVFVSRSGNRNNAFNSESLVTRTLHDIVCLFSGTVQPRNRREGLKFTSLLQTSGESGLLKWDEFTTASFNPMAMQETRNLKPNPRRFDDKFAHVIAAKIENSSTESPINVIFCADADLISDWFFVERNRGNLDIDFDNVAFVLNAVDSLAGDETFIELRSRRASLRTLKYVEDQTRELRKKLGQEEKEAEESKDERLKVARAELQKAVDEIQKQQGLDEESRALQIQQKQEELSRKLELEETELDREKNARIRKAGLEMKRRIRSVENKVRLLAYVSPAILPVCFGLLFLGLRNLAEQNSISPNRRRQL
ncbi:MAG: Gldg family protein [Planctomyces sp.]|nr:Gldg family protein [Planctomyces sp.]